MGSMGTFFSDVSSCWRFRKLPKSAISLFSDIAGGRALRGALLGRQLGSWYFASRRFQTDREAPQKKPEKKKRNLWLHHLFDKDLFSLLEWHYTISTRYS
jgi:hypothetical protein